MTAPTAQAKDNSADVALMRVALALARRGLGQVWPNPAVGCVLVAEAAGRPRVIGRGWTQPGGRPHAEPEALRRAAAAGASVKGATAYVTLEPCSHHGRSPPCADALVEAGIARAVVAHVDPDPRVSGEGIAKLRDAGIAVEIGLGEAEARAINAGFLLRTASGRPRVTWKTATSLDGRIATAGGESQWITGPAARQWGHRLRAEHDAVLIGSGTALADDPTLTCRLPGLQARSPVRVVLDSRLRLPADAALVRTASDVPTWLVTTADNEDAAQARYGATGVEVIAVAAADGRVDAAAALQALGGRGLTRVLVEGGGELAASLLRAGLVDRIAWFRGNQVLGGDAQPAAGPLALDSLDAAPGFRRVAVDRLGADVVETLECDPSPGAA
jgi:diaminohydroxyphosphoribosylaminopyrimidine deaminase/5-amino-6-(5-phosphoribosylamino)uracil reductase